MNPTQCDTCWYYDYDEEYDEYYCMMDLDEDEVYRIFSQPHAPRQTMPMSRAAIVAKLMSTATATQKLRRTRAKMRFVL